MSAQQDHERPMLDPGQKRARCAHQTVVQKEVEGFTLLSPRELALVEAVAHRVVVLLDERDRVARRLVSAQELAGMLGVSRSTVYQHAIKLGAGKVGDGPRGRLRFDPEMALAAWTACSVSKESQDPKSPVDIGLRRRRRQRPMGSKANLLPIRGGEAA